MMGEIASDTKTAIYTWSLMTKYVHIYLYMGAGPPEKRRTGIIK